MRGGLLLSGLTSAKGLKLPKAIGTNSGYKISGSLDLSGLTSAEGLVLQVWVGGQLYLDGLTSTDGLDLSQVSLPTNSVGSDFSNAVYLSGLTKTDRSALKKQYPELDIKP